MQNKVVNFLEKYSLLAIIFLTPLSISPLFPNYYTTTKIVLFVLLLCVAILAKFAKTIIKGTLTWASSPFDFPLLLLGIAYIASAVWQTPDKMEAFFIPGNTTIIIGAILMYFLLNQLENTKKIIKIALTISATIFSLVTVFCTFKLYSFLPFLPAVIKDPSFNLEGSSTSGIIFLVSCLPFVLNLVLNHKKLRVKIVSILSLAIIVSGIAASIVQTLPSSGKATNLPSFFNSWAITFDTLKNNPLLGIGPGNYLTAYNLYRPLSSNSEASWNLRFTSGRSTYLTIITETGLLGLAALAIFFSVIYKELKLHFAKMGKKTTPEIFVAQNEIPASLIMLLILLLIFPATISLILLLTVLLSLTASPKISTLDMTAKADTQISHFPAILLSLPFIAAVLAFVYYSYIALDAEITYAQALRAITQNNGKMAYDTLIKTINTNPQVDRYHLSYAQINLALASTLAQNQNLTDTDKNTIAQLVQQAIREGKAAVTLNSERSGNWATLANIYQSVMPLATDADKFAVQTYTQAITLDPINPDLRISLCGLYMSLKQPDQAIQACSLAVTVKPDYANAHYNLAAAYKAKGETDQAKAELTAVLSLLDKNSPDYQKANDELTTLGSSTPAETPAPTATPKPVIELPKEATPPATP